jgi:predicted nucleic acid-binding protein
MKLLLDTTPLSNICHPAGHPIQAWVHAQLTQGSQLIISEVADYEVRRELIRAGKQRSIERLNALKRFLSYAPVNTGTFLRAAELWAEARNPGLPTAPTHSLDADVIIAAQAEQVRAVVVMGNVRHLAVKTEHGPSRIVHLNTVNRPCTPAPNQ